MRDYASGSLFFRQHSLLPSVITQVRGQQLVICSRQSSNTSWESSELGAELVQSRFCGEAAAATEAPASAAFSKGKTLHWGLGHHLQQHASRWSSISWPALRSQLQVPSQTRIKHNLPHCPCKGYMPLYYGSSLQHIHTNYNECISEQSLSQTETGHQGVKTEQMQWVTSEKQEKFAKGFPPLLSSLVPISIQHHRLRASVTGLDRELWASQLCLLNRNRNKFCSPF